MSYHRPEPATQRPELQSFIDKADLRGADMSGLDLRGLNFRGKDLRGVNFNGANLSGVNLSNCNLGPLLSDRKWICKYCHSKNNKEDNNCPHCGAPGEL